MNKHMMIAVGVMFVFDRIAIKSLADSNLRLTKRLKDREQMINYMAEMMDKYGVPVTEFDEMVMNTLNK